MNDSDLLDVPPGRARLDVHGTLGLPTLVEPVRCRLIVLDTADVCLVLHIPTSGSLPPRPPKALSGAVGQTDAGERFAISGGLLWTKGNGSLPGLYRWEFTVVGAVIVFPERPPTVDNSGTFAIVNLALEGTDVSSAPAGIRGALHIHLGDWCFELTPFADYDRRLHTLKRFHGVLQTFVLTCNRRHTVAEPSTARDAADRLCLLLTLASGGLVTWTDQAAANREPSVIRGAITRGFRRAHLIDTTDPVATRAFLECAWRNFDAVDQVFPVRRLAHAWSDLAGDVFLETRVMLAAPLTELLVNTVGRASGWSHRHERQTSYLQRMTESLSVLGVQMPESRLRAAVKARNRLVHEVELTKPAADTASEVVGVLSAIVLALFGYEGEYCIGWIKSAWPCRSLPPERGSCSESRTDDTRRCTLTSGAGGRSVAPAWAVWTPGSPRLASCAALSARNEQRTLSALTNDHENASLQ